MLSNSEEQVHQRIPLLPTFTLVDSVHCAQYVEGRPWTYRSTHPLSPTLPLLPAWR